VLSNVDLNKNQMFLKFPACTGAAVRVWCITCDLRAASSRIYSRIKYNVNRIVASSIHFPEALR